MLESERILGRRGVLEALRANRRELRTLYAAKNAQGKIIEEILDLARKIGLPVTTVERDFLEKKSRGVMHQGVMLEAGPLPILDTLDLVARARERGEVPFLVALDKIEDPMNAGAIIRTACAAGCHGLILLANRAVPLSETVARSSAGALEHLPIAQVSNLDHALRELREAGVWIAGASMEGEGNFWEADLDRPVCLVIGSEGQGLRELTRKRCDFMVRIPMNGPIDSLNASVAAGLLIYEALRQRNG